MSKKNPLILAKSDFKKRISETEFAAEFIEAVNDGNGRAQSFIYDIYDLVDLARAAEKRLDAADLPQAMRVGFFAIFQPAGPWANAYKYAAASRYYAMKRTAKGWVLVDIGEAKVFPKSPARVEYLATAEQRAEIARRAVADITEKAAA